MFTFFTFQRFTFCISYFHGPSLDTRLEPLALSPEFSAAVAASDRHRAAGYMAVSCLTCIATRNGALWRFFFRHAVFALVCTTVDHTHVHTQACITKPASTQFTRTRAHLLLTTSLPGSHPTQLDLMQWSRAKTRSRRALMTWKQPSAQRCMESSFGTTLRAATQSLWQDTMPSRYITI
jgi:hypothetical protein